MKIILLLLLQNIYWILFQLKLLEVMQAAMMSAIPGIVIARSTHFMLAKSNFKFAVLSNAAFGAFTFQEYKNC